MNDKVLSRFIKMMILALIVSVAFVLGYQHLSPSEDGDYYVREGDIRLTSGEFDDALISFNKALEQTPDHRGALMGRAIVFMSTNRPDDAITEYTYLIDYLTRTLSNDDPTGRGALAAAYANRGIVHDRMARYQKAYEDYVQSIRVDYEAVEGPGVIDKILHNATKWSSVRDRAIYLHKQFQLPENQRVLRIPELDAEQRMLKP